MDVKKIFIILITVVVCIVIGAVILNLVVPNAVSLAINYVEYGIYRGTGLVINLNADTYGAAATDFANPPTAVSTTSEAGAGSGGVGVEGW